MTASSTNQEDGARFAFGRNWERFAVGIDEPRVKSAVAALQGLLQEESLTGKRFLDAGCGSGLSALAAVELGAEVHSFDFDPTSVKTSERLRADRGCPAERWVIEEGSVLDAAYLERLGLFDIVYSWGVLHHTGLMWTALERMADLVRPGGKLAIAIYNDQGGASRRWLAVKRLYVRSPAILQNLLIFAIGLFFETRSVGIRLVRRQNPLPFKDWALHRQDRGMSVWHDLRDWIGGYPFEVAKPGRDF